MLKGLIFDMDGTITLSEPLHFKAYSSVLAEFGVHDYTYEEAVRKYSGSGSKVIFTEVLAKHGISLTADLIEQAIAKKRALYTKFVRESEIPVVPGVKEFLQRIEGKNFKRIIATGNSDLASVRFMLERAGVSEFFPELLSVTEVPRSKPFPDVFLEGARRIGCAPHECIVFEDAINGVRAAHAAGVRCIGLETTTPREDLLNAGASVVVKNYTEVTDQLLYGK